MPPIDIKQSLLDAVDSVFEDGVGVDLVGLCTSDGFDVISLINDKLDVEGDKLAAVASSLYSLSHSCASQLMGKGLMMTTVETNDGNALFLKVDYLGSPCILSIASSASVSLATLRFIAKRLATTISEIA